MLELPQYRRFLFFTTVLFHLSLATVNHHHHRRFLHQPFFQNDPTISQPPSISPSAQPKYPFTSSSTPPLDGTSSSIGPLFFPFSTSPPPPPPTPTPQATADNSAAVTFPANISSLVLPTSDNTKNSKVSAKLVSLIVSLSLLFVLVIALIVFFSYRHRMNNPYHRQPLNAHSIHNPDEVNNACTSATEQKQVLRKRGISGEEDECVNYANAPGKSAVLVEVGSPELHPLPPLSVLPLQNYYTTPITATINPNKVVLTMNTSASAGTSNSSLSANDSMKKEDNEQQEQYHEEEDDDGEDGDDDEFFSPRTTPIHNSLNNVNFRGSGFSKYKGTSFLNPSFNWENPSPQTHSDHHQHLNACPFSPSSFSVEDSVKSPDYPFITSIPHPVAPPQPVAFSPFSPSHTDETNTLECSPRPSSCFSVGSMPPPPANGPPELAPPTRGKASFGNSGEIKATTPKFNPLHWDKVMRVGQERPVVWDPFKKSTSFQMDEEMIETLFMKGSSNSNPKVAESKQESHILDPSKSQDIVILLRALNVTVEEVCESLIEGNADALGSELLESLLKMTPTEDEEEKLKKLKDASADTHETFLKSVLEIPFAFKRIEAMLYIVNFEPELEHLKRSFDTVESACKELKSSRMFRKVLEAVLKTGNHMNIHRGEACGYKLDTLTKLVDVKGSDGKLTLLHFVVQEITRVEGSRLAGKNTDQSTDNNPQDEVELRKLGLQVVSRLSGELTNVKKAASMDRDSLVDDVEKLCDGISKVVEVVRLHEEVVGITSSSEYVDRRFSDNMNEFLKKAEFEIANVQAQEGIALSMVKGLTEYFHGDSSREEANPLRIFVIVRDFLLKLDRVCKDIAKMNERALMNSAREIQMLADSGFH